MLAQSLQSIDKITILAVLTHHCAFKIRKRYYFETPIYKESLLLFDDMELEVIEFSKFVKDANDYFKLVSIHPPLFISGVISEKVFDVFFGSMKTSSKEDDLQTVKQFEERLLQLNFGNTIQQQDNSPG
ncbi:MAG: hypothetical protein HRU20_00820 [Pseudomonadales bacterium]|nr:hypothetical protein [Pseudomonadales bacterium]